MANDDGLQVVDDDSAGTESHAVPMAAAERVGEIRPLLRELPKRLKANLNGLEPGIADVRSARQQPKLLPINPRFRLERQFESIKRLAEEI
jgi:hypothetical protein